MKKKKKFLLLLLLFLSICSFFPTQQSFLWNPVNVMADTKLVAPKLLLIKVRNSSTISLKWEAVDGADGYRIYRKTADSKWKLVRVFTNPKTLTYKNINLSMGTTYTYTVRAFKRVNGKIILGSYDKTGLSATTTISAPELVSATALSNTSISLKWNTVSVADSYRIYRKEPGGKWKLVKTISDPNITSYTNSKLKTGRKYYYTVRACKLVNGSIVLGKYNKTGINATTKMTTPALVSIKSTGSSSAALTWQATPGVDGYQIYRKTADSGWKLIKTITSAETVSYTDNTLVNGITYYYTVRAYNVVEETYVRSGYNKTGLKVTAKTPKITGITAKETSTSSIQIQWSAAKNVDGYRIYRKIGTGSWKIIGTISDGNTTSYTDQNAEIGITYYYTVRGYKKVNNTTLLGYYDSIGVSATIKKLPSSFENEKIILLKGETHNLTLSEGTAASWKSSDSTIVSVSNGTVTGHKAGKATITAVVDGQEITCSIVVEEPVLPENFSVIAGESKLLTLEGTTQTVEWSKMGESREGVIELIPANNNSILIKALKPGKAYIRAKIADHQFTFDCTIRIDGYITPDRTTLVIREGERVQINISTNYNIYGLSENSMDSQIASVYPSDYSSADCAVTIYGHSSGSTIIRIASESSDPAVYADIAVTVIEKSTESSGAATLINYLERNGYLENGIRQFKLCRYIDYEEVPYQSILSVGYEEATSKFHFYASTQTASSLEEVSMSILDHQTTDITVRYQYTAENTSFLAETTINTATFTGELVPFRLLKSEGLSEEEIAQMLEQASKEFDSSFNDWTIRLLNEHAGTVMKELGFVVHNTMN